MIRKFLRKALDSLGKYRLYFNRGYITYIAIFLTLFNFVTIAYHLVIQNVPFLHNLFPRFWLFGVIFLVILIPSATLLGRFDYKRGTFKEEQLVALSLTPVWNRTINPIWKEIFERLERIEEKIDEKIDGKIDEKTMDMKKNGKRRIRKI